MRECPRHKKEMILEKVVNNRFEYYSCPNEFCEWGDLHDLKLQRRPNDAALRILRHKCHKLLDKCWTNAKERGVIYRWIAETMKLPRERAHIGKMNNKQCMTLMIYLITKPPDVNELLRLKMERKALRAEKLKEYRKQRDEGNEDMAHRSERSLKQTLIVTKEQSEDKYVELVKIGEFWTIGKIAFIPKNEMNERYLCFIKNMDTGDFIELDGGGVESSEHAFEIICKKFGLRYLFAQKMEEM